MNSLQPIGVFDSGIGGLTIARSLVDALPREDIIYFGDTVHMPYGDKFVESIQNYSLKITQLLLDKGCKLILIACNSASAVSYDFIVEYVAGRALVVNVIDPVVQYIKQYYAQRQVGLIGTTATVNSNIYQKKIDGLNLGIKLYARATPLLAAAIENGFVAQNLLNSYFKDSDLMNIDALILGCTHYPIIKDEIAKIYSGNTEILDATYLAADAVKNVLQSHDLLNNQGGNKRFFVSNYTDTFAANTKLFFSDTVSLERYPLWDL